MRHGSKTMPLRSPRCKPAPSRSTQPQAGPPLAIIIIIIIIISSSINNNVIIINIIIIIIIIITIIICVDEDCICPIVFPRLYTGVGARCVRCLDRI